MNCKTGKNQADSARNSLRALTTLLVFIFFVGLVVACDKKKPDAIAIVEQYQGGATYSPLKIAYPRNGTLFPAELPSPKIFIEDSHSGADMWAAEFRFADGTRLFELVPNTGWRLPEAVWNEIRKRAVDQPVVLRFFGFLRDRPQRILSVGEVSMAVSSDKVGAPLFYREVNLPFIDAVKDPSKIRWRFGSIDALEPPPVVLTDLPVCGNCHSFSRDGKVLGMDVDYANDKGSYALVPVEKEIILDNGKIITWSDYRREDGKQTFGLLSAVSPDGRHVISTVKDRSVFVPQPNLEYSQLFFPVQGLLAVYDRATKSFSALRGAADPAFVQSNAAWSPDGKTVAFTRSEAYALELQGQNVLLTQQEAAAFLSGERKFRYDIYSLPFKEGKGGVAEPVVGASGNGRSNYFPRYSPDGKWLVFCQADSFSLLQPDSKLYIVPAAGGEARLMNCNTGNMNSWHTFSPDGKWMVFASKEGTPYTRLYITHIDENGNDTPGVLLEYLTAPDRAANIPEFVNLAPTDIVKIKEQFVTDRSLVRTGEENEKLGDIAGAERFYRKALEQNPDNAVAHMRLGNMLHLQGEHQAAMASAQRALALSPQNVHANILMGVLLGSERRLQEAMGYERTALALEPENADAHFNLAAMLFEVGRLPEAKPHFEAAFRFDKNRVVAKEALARICRIEGDTQCAIRHLEEALKEEPDFEPASAMLIELKSSRGRP